MQTFNFDINNTRQEKKKKEKDVAPTSNWLAERWWNKAKIGQAPNRGQGYRSQKTRTSAIANSEPFGHSKHVIGCILPQKWAKTNDNKAMDLFPRNVYIYCGAALTELRAVD
jgi:hypothetical protein